MKKEIECEHEFTHIESEYEKAYDSGFKIHILKKKKIIVYCRKCGLITRQLRD